MSDDSLFISKAPWIMRGLIKEFGLSEIQGAAILGNIGHECAGFTMMQEGHPVGGCRGGYGWCQWTGVRRDQFERYAAEHHLSVDSDKANYGFLVWELHNTERGAVIALRGTDEIDPAVRAFEAHFERADPRYKDYSRRVRYAKVALSAYQEHHFDIAEAVLSVSAPATLALVSGAVSDGGTAAVAALAAAPSAFQTKLVAIARDEIHRYGEFLEQQSPLRERIGEYWAFLGRPDLDGADHEVAWSAAFISFMVHLAGAGTAFPYNAQHSVYFYRTINDKVTKRKTAFWGYRPEDLTIMPGDIIGMNRSGAPAIDYEWAEHHADYKSHSDIVVAVGADGIHTIGGNVGHAPGQVAGKTFKFTNGVWVHGTSHSHETVFVVIRSSLPCTA